MYKYILIVLLSIVVEINESYAIGVSSIGGMSVDASVPLPPSGLCRSGIFSLTNAGTVNSGVVGTGRNVFKVGPTENSYGGVGYGLAVETATSNTRLLTFNLDTTPATLTGNVLVNTGNNPDSSVGVLANIYDNSRVGSGAFLVFGTQVVAPCTGGSSNCIHIRGYTDTTTSLDIISAGINTTTEFDLAYMVPDSSSYWVEYQVVGGSVIRKFNSGLSSVGVIASTPNGYGGITSDNTYIYATVDLAGVPSIRRIRISDLAITDFALAGSVGMGITYANGFLFVGQTGEVRKVRTSDMTSVGVITTVGETALGGGVEYDAVNNKIYVAGASAGAITFRRINPDTFVSEQSLVIGTVLIASSQNIGFDFIHQRIWEAIGGAGNNFVLQKINLCS